MTKLFVPGRLCLFGEHTDWAGHYRTMNADIVPGAAIVTGIEQGIYAEVEKSSLFEVQSVAPQIENEWQDFACRMDEQELKRIAKSGSFFCYCAGVASYMLEWYKVGGVRIKITSMTLPMKSGLSSSAAICVLVARAFNILYNLNLNTLGEMNIAYVGELRTTSRCGRLDQACAFGVKPNLMTFDGDEVEVQSLNVKKPLYWVFADLCGEKNTVKILRDLNRAYPFASNEQEEREQQALGELNQDIVNRAIKCMAEGEVEQLGKLMNEAGLPYDMEHGDENCVLSVACRRKKHNNRTIVVLENGGADAGCRSQMQHALLQAEKAMGCRQSVSRRGHTRNSAHRTSRHRGTRESGNRAPRHRRSAG